MKQLLVIFTVIGLLALTPARAEVPQDLTWDHLIPGGTTIVDPLRDLTPDQAVEIELLASINAKRKLGMISDVASESEFGVEIEARLRGAGLDVDGLVNSYIQFQAALMKLNSKMVTELDGQLVRIPGYALPLEFDGTAVEEFLLVPYVGACIHVPAPPKNQMVYVQLKQSYIAKSLYEPIWIVGRMKVKDASKKLKYFDGEADVQAGYTLEAVRIEPYKE